MKDETMKTERNYIQLIAGNSVSVPTHALLSFSLFIRRRGQKIICLSSTATNEYEIQSM